MQRPFDKKTGGRVGGAAAVALAGLLAGCAQTPQDADAPQVSLYIPTTYSDPQVLDVQVRASDDVGVTRLSLSRSDGQGPFAVLKSVQSAPFSFTYSDRINASGTYTYRAQAEDASGRVRTLEQAVEVTLP